MHVLTGRDLGASGTLIVGTQVFRYFAASKVKQQLSSGLENLSGT